MLQGGAKISAGDGRKSRSDLNRSAATESREIVLVASGSVEDIAMAERNAQALTSNGVLTYAVSARQELVNEYCQRRPGRVVTVPLSFGSLLRSALRLRRHRDLTLLVTTGRSGYRRLKLFGVLCGVPYLFVLNENGDFAIASPLLVARHLGWRLRQKLRRVTLSVTAGMRSIRTQGCKATLEKLVQRFRFTGRSLYKIRAKFNRFGRPVVLPSFSMPQVSIVIPAHNQWKLTLQALRSIVDSTSRISYEVILVDDGSTDATRNAERLVPGLRVVRAEESRGFVESCNNGAKVTRGDFIMLLNNDVLVTPGWLEALVRVARLRPRSGAVGARLLYPNGRLQEAGGIVWRDGSAHNCGRHDYPDRPEYDYVREVDYVSGAALLVRRAAWEEVGGFDTSYSPGYWEDVDLCFELRDRGYSVWYQPRCEIVHLEGGSAGTDVREGMKRHQLSNADRFQDKWETAIDVQHPCEPRYVFKARDRNHGPVVLVFDHYVPEPDRDAGSVFMFEFLATIRDMGYRIIFWPDNLYRTPEYSEELQEMGIEIRFGRESVKEYLLTHGEFVDYAVAYRAEIADEYLPVTRNYVRSQAYIAVDLEHVREQRRARAIGERDHGSDGYREREARILEIADLVGTHSSVEGEILDREFGAVSVHELPLPVALPEATRASYEDRDGLVFVGSTHPPNVDAVRYFVDQVFPLVRAQIPEMRLRVVGEVCSQLKDYERLGNIELIGHVPDLAKPLNRSRVFVSPLRYGAGIKGKILTAMSGGVPVVTTSVGAEGIERVSGRSCLIADGVEELVAAIVEVYMSESLWKELRRSGLELALTISAQERFEEQVDRFMSMLTGDRQHRCSRN